MLTNIVYSSLSELGALVLSDPGLRNDVMLTSILYFNLSELGAFVLSNPRR